MVSTHAYRNDSTATELTRRGFIVVAVSAGASFFIEPTLADALAPGKAYIVSMKTIGYGHLWPEEAEDDPDFMALFEPDEAEVQREELGPGSKILFEQDPELDRDEPWLDVVSADGEKLCDIPWSGTPAEEAAVMLIVDKINEGREVWGEVTQATHATLDAGPDKARIHTLEFDVFYR